MNDESLEDGLIDVIGASGGTDYLTDVAELSLDRLTDNDLVKEVPVLKTFVALYKVGVGVKGYLFARKLKKFLFALSDVPVNEREQFVNQLNADKEVRNRVGETLLLILDKLDDFAKTDLVAKAFKALIRDEIDFVMFQRLTTAIDRCFVSDLGILGSIDRRAEIEAPVAQVLMSTGMLELDTIPAVRGPGPESRNLYRITDLGRSFVQVVLQGS